MFSQALTSDLTIPDNVPTRRSVLITLVLIVATTALLTLAIDAQTPRDPHPGRTAFFEINRGNH